MIAISNTASENKYQRPFEPINIKESKQLSSCQKRILDVLIQVKFYQFNGAEYTTK